jgi:hypothetical protein
MGQSRVTQINPTSELPGGWEFWSLGVIPAGPGELVAPMSEGKSRQLEVT